MGMERGADEVEQQGIRQADYQGVANWLQTNRVAEPHLEPAFSDLVGQRSAQGRHDLRIVVAHFLKAPGAQLPQPVARINLPICRRP